MIIIKLRLQVTDEGWLPHSGGWLSALSQLKK